MQVSVTKCETKEELGMDVSLQNFSLYQSHKCAQKPVQGHKLNMILRFCFCHSTKYT